MTQLVDISKRVLRIFRAIGLVLLVVLAVASIAARIITPRAAMYKDQIELLVSDIVKSPVSIDNVKVYWHALGPRAEFEGVNLYDQSRAQTLLHLSKMQVSFNLFKVIGYRQWLPDKIKLEGLRLSITRLPDGGFSVNEISIAQPAGAPSNQEVLRNWLLKQNRLLIKAEEVYWHDLKAGLKPLKFSDVTIMMINSGLRHRLLASTMLPVNLGHRVFLYGDITGNIFKPLEWIGRFYMRGYSLRLTEWAQQREMLGYQLESGIADTELWSHWQGATLKSLTGNINLLSVDLKPVAVAQPPSAQEVHASPRRAINLDGLQAKFRWRRHDIGWTLDAEQFSVTTAQGAAPPSLLRVGLVEQEGAREIEVGAGVMQLKYMLPLLANMGLISDDAGRVLHELDPDVELNNAYLRYRKKPQESAPHVLIATQFRDASVRPWKKLPGISGLDGALAFAEDTGVVDVDSHDARFDFGERFRAPIVVDQAQGRVVWAAKGGAWKVKAEKITAQNRDIAVQANAWLERESQHVSPLMQLVLSCANGNVAATKHYLPVTIMPASVVEWLDRALVRGRVTSGLMVLQGRLRDFPYADNNGRFQVALNVSEGILDYAPGWPRIEEIETEVGFSGRSLSVNAHQGKLFDSDIINASVHIANMAQRGVPVEIRGSVRGPVNDGLRLLRESPLAEKFGRQAKDMSATGSGRLDLAMDIPLRKGRAARLEGKLALDNNDLLIAKSIDINHIKGILGFSHKGMSSERIEAKVLGRPALISIKTVEGVRGAAEELATIFTGEGTVSVKELNQRFTHPAFEHLSGDATWKGTLTIPAAITGKNPILRLVSPLQGVAIKLPSPLAKRANEVVPLVLETRLPLSAGRAGVLRYGRMLRARYAFKKQEQGLALDRGEIRLGGQEAILPESEGLRLAGELKHFSWEEWQGLLPEAAPKPGAAGVNLTALDIHIDDLELYKRHISDIAINAIRNDVAWQATLDGPQTKGVIRVPHDKKAIMVMNMETLVIPTAPKDLREDKKDPRLLPPLQISAVRFVYGDIEAGSLNLATTTLPNGLHVENFQLTTPNSSIIATGDWAYQDQEEYSAYMIKITSNDLGKMLNRYKYSGAIREGKAQADLTLQWPGGLEKIPLERLNGQVNLRIDHGRLLDVDPGAGRIFGLLSIQALPRRLGLDFSDFFKKGFAFDTMKGDFVIKDGNAHTDNFRMKGPAATIEMQGRIGLAARDYDQQVVVIPEVTSGLPLAGVIVGGVGGGAAALLVEKLIKPGIKDITKIEYTVSGSWEQPEVKRVEKKGKN